MNPAQTIPLEIVTSPKQIHQADESPRSQDVRFREYMDVSFTRRFIEHFNRAKIAAFREK